MGKTGNSEGVSIRNYSGPMQVSETRSYGILKSQKIQKRMMVLKKYFVFIISFILLYTVFQILSGVILICLLYSAIFTSIEGNLSQEVVFG